jgi:hypothetical protein
VYDGASPRQWSRRALLAPAKLTSVLGICRGQQEVLATGTQAPGPRVLRCDRSERPARRRVINADIRRIDGAVRLLCAYNSRC